MRRESNRFVTPAIWDAVRFCTQVAVGHPPAERAVPAEDSETAETERTAPPSLTSAAIFTQREQRALWYG